jgi:hypothetical protein
MLRDKMLSEGNNETSKKAQIELEAFSFSFRNGTIETFYIFKDKEGNNIEFPKLSEYSDDYLDYLISRMEGSKNPFLKSRYAHILWCSKRKHGRFAQIALESYNSLLRLYQDEYMISGDYESELVDVIRNIYSISTNIKQLDILSLIKISIHKLIPIFSENRRKHFNLWVPLIEMILNEKKAFQKNELVGTDTLCFIMGDHQRNIGNLNHAILLFSLGKRVEMRMGTETYRWFEHIAKCYEELMNQSRDNLIAIMHCQNAISNYEKSNNIMKVDRLEKKYFELKSTIGLKCSKFNFDISDILNFCSNLTRELLTKDANYIIYYLMNFPDLLPRYQNMDKMANDQLKQFVFISLFPESIIDNRGHIAEYVATNEEKKYHQILFNYKLAIDMSTLPLLNSILMASVCENKLTLDGFLYYLKENTWYGETITKTLPGNRVYIYSWINLLIPSLKEYFLQMSYYSLSGNSPNFMLCIDSLSLKLEGLLRDLCEFNNIKTYYFINDKFNRKIAREKDINMLLHEDCIKEFINEDDLLFLKYLLVEKAGMNLRNKIAHALVQYNEYNINTMNLLILALLKLGKYNFVK